MKSSRDLDSILDAVRARNAYIPTKEENDLEDLCRKLTKERIATGQGDPEVQRLLREIQAHEVDLRRNKSLLEQNVAKKQDQEMEFERARYNAACSGRGFVEDAWMMKQDGQNLIRFRGMAENLRITVNGLVSKLLPLKQQLDARLTTLESERAASAKVVVASADLKHSQEEHRWPEPRTKQNSSTLTKILTIGTMGVAMLLSLSLVKKFGEKVMIGAFGAFALAVGFLIRRNFQKQDEGKAVVPERKTIAGPDAHPTTKHRDGLTRRRGALAQRVVAS
jgi:hypothetical protein